MWDFSTPSTFYYYTPLTQQIHSTSYLEMMFRSCPIIISVRTFYVVGVLRDNFFVILALRLKTESFPCTYQDLNSRSLDLISTVLACTLYFFVTYWSQKCKFMQQLAPAHFNTNETDKIDMVLCELSQNRRNS